MSRRWEEPAGHSIGLYNYDAKNQLKSITYQNGYYSYRDLYIWQDNKIVYNETGFENEAPLSSFNYEYNEDGNISTITSNGNTYYNNDSTVTTYVEYDDHPNPAKTLKGFSCNIKFFQPNMLLSNNNAIKYSSGNSSSSTIKYRYNKDGLPIEMKDEQGNTTVYTYEKI